MALLRWTWRCEMRGPISSHEANSSPHRALLWFKDWLAPGLMGIGMNNLSRIKVEENGILVSEPSMDLIRGASTVSTPSGDREEFTFSTSSGEKWLTSRHTFQLSWLCLISDMPLLCWRDMARA
ncbi:hypothetical protein F7725_007144 [Dissostichus mawsoni]|uniref:Uncharacterized protein n=1 Tax=Dissostichus mawsoni TaxID=36200 RepID=A0A7J5XW05_DISMA|nr:hypothetical protein F7725_007144 [Dissostichus mawsoni]